MKRTLIYTIAFVLFIFLGSAFSYGKTNIFKHKWINNIYLYQNGTETPIALDSSVIFIAKKNFSLRFYNQKYHADTKEFYAARMAAFYTASPVPDIKIGMPINSIPCFMSGTGFAGPENNYYPSLIFNRWGHHYLFYQDEENKRLNLITEKGKIQKFELNIDSLNFWGHTESISETRVSQFYLLMIIDRNLNQIIDKGEYIKLTIRVKGNYKGWDECFWNQQDEEGQTPLHRLFLFQQWENISEPDRLLVLKEALSCTNTNLNLTDKYGNTALHYAVYTHYLPTENKLHFNKRSNSIKMIKALLEQEKCDVNIRDYYYKQTPLMEILTDRRNIMSRNRDKRYNEILDLLMKRQDLNLTYKNNINEKAYDYNSVLKRLPKESIPTDKYNQNTSWELKRMISMINYDVSILYDSTFFRSNIQTCIDHDADPNFLHGDSSTPLIWLCSTKHRPHGYSDDKIESNMKLRALLLKQLLATTDININLPDQTGNTPLHLAAEDHNPLLVKALLNDVRTNSNSMNTEGNTPLMSLLINMKYSDPDQRSTKCLQAFILNSDKINFKVINYQGMSMLDIINTGLLNDKHKEYMQHLYPEMYALLIQLKQMIESSIHTNE